MSGVDSPGGAGDTEIVIRSLRQSGESHLSYQDDFFGVINEGGLGGIDYDMLDLSEKLNIYMERLAPGALTQGQASRIISFVISMVNDLLYRHNGFLKPSQDSSHEMSKHYDFIHTTLHEGIKKRSDTIKDDLKTVSVGLGHRFFGEFYIPTRSLGMGEHLGTRVIRSSFSSILGQLNAMLADDHIRDHRELIQTLNQQLKTDKFGIIGNREATMHFLNTLRLSEPGELSVVMIDIDGFKNVNDTHGHDSGDIVLKELCQIILDELKSHFGEGDGTSSENIPGLTTKYVASRYGGDEFCVVIKGNSADAILYAESLRSRIEENYFSIKYTDKKLITLSIGIGHSIITPQDTIFDIFRLILSDADHAAYCSKALGKNQVNIAPVGPPDPKFKHRRTGRTPVQDDPLV